MNNPNAVIVQLAPGGESSLQVSSFRDAFEGYSNIKGKGRARRAKKKATKQANKQTKRMTRINNRQERHSTKKTNRQGNRLQHAQAKNARKDEKQGGRLGRKANRKASRGTDEVLPPEDEQDDTLMGQEDAGAAQSEAGYEPTGGEQSEQGDGEEVTEESEAINTDDTAPNDDVEMVEETEEWRPETGADAPDYGFNGEEAGSVFDNEAQDGSVVINIHPAVKETAKKIVWNEMKAHAFDAKIGKGGDDADCTAKRDSHLARAEQLENMLGEYSNARGGRGGGLAARKEVAVAKVQARQEARAAARPAKAAPAPSRMPFRRRGAPAPAPKPTPVAANLDPKISDDEISIPSDEVNEEFAGGTGTYAQEGIGASPAETRTVELSSGFDGKAALKNINWKQVAVGSALAIGVIAILKATKVI